jgi:hypothetical protein
MRIKGTRKFGKLRYTLKWNSSSVDIGPWSPSNKKVISEKKMIAKMWAADYFDKEWDSKITTYNGGKDFKVWIYPK